MAAFMAHVRKAPLFLLLFLVLDLNPGPTSHPAIPITRITEPLLISSHVTRERKDPYGLSAFVESVKNGEASSIVGVYVPGTFSLPVVQQPPGQDLYVSDEPGVLTQFRSASRFRTTGLLAHNTLAGALYFQLRLGQRVTLVRGDGRLQDYEITSIRQFQALQPEDPYSKFIDLDTPQGEITSSTIFNQFYTQGDLVVFQTCIARDGNSSWGRIFVIANPMTDIVSSR